MLGKISPSIMCADFRNLENTIKKLEETKVEYLHFDIMDGNFVPNFALGPSILKCIREITNIPFDLHLMIKNPENHLELFDIRPGDIVSVHVESTIHLQRLLQKIKQLEAKAAVALNPATPIYMIEDILEDLDMVLVMTVNPGFAGQKLVPATLKKIARLDKYLQGKGFDHIEIEVDGNVSYENAKKMRAAGADIFVAGTSSIFIKEKNIVENINKLRVCII